MLYAKYLLQSFIYDVSPWLESYWDAVNWATCNPWCLSVCLVGEPDQVERSDPFEELLGWWTNEQSNPHQRINYNYISETHYDSFSYMQPIHIII
jgi:hypothetical protein